jgi:hypothetical protein
MTLVPPLDADGLVVPDVPVAGALELARGLDGAVRAMSDLDAALAATEVPPHLWSGAAAATHAASVGALRLRVEAVAVVASACGGVLQEWASDAASGASAMAAARGEIVAVRGARRAAEAAGVSWSADLSRREDAAWSAWDRAKSRYWRACEHAAAALHRLYPAVPDRPLGPTDHAIAFVRSAWRAGIDEPVAQAWSLTGAAASDPHAWREAWAALPGTVWQAFRHPRQLLQDALGLPAWSDGRYGDGAGTVAAAALSAGRGAGAGATGRVAHQVPLAFADGTRFAAFGERLHAGLAHSGFPGVQAIVQGSSVTGHKYTSGAPFDDGRLSDLDVALADRGLFRTAVEAGVEVRGAGTRTAPLHAEDLRTLGLDGVQQELSGMAGRPVRFMVYESADVASARAPGVVVPR